MNVSSSSNIEIYLLAYRQLSYIQVTQVAYLKGKYVSRWRFRTDLHYSQYNMQ